MFTLMEIALTIGVLVVLLSAVSACVCGCRNSNQKSELVGTAGVVKINYEDEAPSPTPTTPNSVKRASTQNSHRSLPEIPHPVGRHDSGDTTSEIYATVNLDQGVEAVVASTSRDHAYEHAYSKVQNENHIVEIVPDQRLNGDLPIDERDTSHSGPESVVISASVAISGQLPSSQELPYITPPAHAAGAAAAVDNVQHFSGDSTDSAKGYTSISVREPLTNIRAKSNTVISQPHYATVSDDSDEMYAAIEGGSDTYAQIVPQEVRSLELVENRRSLDRELIATVQLHSEPAARRSAPPEMGTSSNATHSRQASTSSFTTSNGALGSPKPEKRQANSPLPPPPSGGPRAPEGNRRSPLPPTLAQRIASTGDLNVNRDKVRRSLNEKHQRNNSCVSSSDFYGCNYPVDKHRYSSGELTRPLVAKELNFDIDNDDLPLYNSIDNPTHDTTDYSTDPNTSINSDQRITESPSRNIEEMYAKVMKKKANDEQKRTSKEYANEPKATPQKYREDDPGYETIDRKKAHHGYETITHKERKISQNNDPGYETVKEIKNQPNTSFSNNNLVNKLNNLMLDSGPNSLISSSDPGYEHINKMDNSASDSDPNYEVLRNQPPTPPYATIASNYKVQPTYSTVNKKKYDWSSNNNDECGLESNYESMPHEPFYTTGSESDPNYESVRPKDPNYESVSTAEPNYESLRLKDPKYESMRSKDSRSKDPNYESVKYMDVNITEPPYEKLNNDVGSSSGVERSDSNAGYESINVLTIREQKSSINSSGEVVEDYFQV